MAVGDHVDTLDSGWFQATSVSPIVRIHKSFLHLIPCILDQGIMGIQVSD
jgi:hypothetical protein